MKREHAVIAAAVGFGLLYWLIDSLVGYAAFHEGTFLGTLITDLSGHHVYHRSTVLVLFLLFGLVLSAYIGKQRRADEALARSGRRYRDLADSIADVFFAMDRDLRYTYWNKASEELTGIPAEEAIGKSLYEVFPDIAGTKAELFYLRALETDQPQNFLNNYALAGKSCVFDITAYPSEQGLSVFAKDVTERRQTEEKLRQSEERLRTVFEAAKNIAFVTTDLGGGEARILDFSPGAEAIFGYSRDEVIGRPLAILHTPEQVEHFSTVTETIRQRKTGLTAELELIRRSGERFPAILTTFPIFDDAGNMVKVLGVSIDITERRRAEEALRESEQFSTNLLSSAPHAIIVVNPDTSVRYVNPAFEKLTGFTSAEIIGRKRPYPWWTEETFEKISRDFDAALRGGAQRLEELVQRKDGEQLWVEVTGVPVTSNGEVQYYLSNWVDITERRRAEEGLRLHAAMMDNVAEGVYLIGLDDLLIRWTNERFARMFGYDPGEMVGKHVDIVNAPTERTPAETRISIVDVLKQTGEWHGEVRNIKRDGTHFWCYANVTLFDHPEYGKVMVSVHNDITERKRAEQAVEKERQRLRTYLDIAGVVFVVLDADETVSLINKKGCELLGYHEEEIIGRKFFDTLVPQRMRQEVIAVFKKLVAGEIEPVEHYENPCLTKTGEERLFSWHNTVIRDEEGKTTGTLSSGEDITERRNLEERLRQEEEALHRAARLESIGKLAGGIAHEFNNLMTGILGYGNLLLGTLDADDPRREDVEEMKAAAQRAARLTQQLLAFSRKQTLQPRSLGLNAAVTSISRMVEHVIGENIQCVTLLDPDLGQIRADPDQIQQVIMNLVVNARDAMPDGGTLTIQTSNADLAETYVKTTPPMPAGAYVLLTVTDTGCGMDEETKEHLFEPFFTTKAPGEGTGLGLSTAYGIVKQHEGYIWADSKPGRGSRFRIYLPRATGEAEVAQAMPPAAQPAPGYEAVLVVEDEEAVRRLVDRVLSANGYTVLAVSSTEEARNVMAAHGDEIALVLTDVILPDGTGPELGRQLEQKHPSLRILYMSGYAENGAGRRSVLEPGTPFLAKPFGPEELLGKVREILSAPPE